MDDPFKPFRIEGEGGVRKKKGEKRKVKVSVRKKKESEKKKAKKEPPNRIPLLLPSAQQIISNFPDIISWVILNRSTE